MSEPSEERNGGAHSAAGEELLPRIVEILQSKQAADVLLMDLRSSTDTTDFFVLCSGTSDQHVKTLADELTRTLKEEGNPHWHIEGYRTRRWVLVDYVDVVVHIFGREAREFYALERLWGDAKRTYFREGGDEPGAEESTPPDQTVFTRP